jgi:TonB family protein
LVPFFPTDWVSRRWGGEGVPLDGSSWAAWETAAPEVLSGPLPVYPELFRQAGIEGRVILEARVDSTGRVQRASISVISATHPGFVEPARQALIATLFRPARVNGRAVLMLVRVPFAFSIRGGTGRAR